MGWSTAFSLVSGGDAFATRRTATARSDQRGVAGPTVRDGPLFGKGLRASPRIPTEVAGACGSREAFTPWGVRLPETMRDASRVGPVLSADQTPEIERGGRKREHPLSIGRTEGLVRARKAASPADERGRGIVRTHRSIGGSDGAGWAGVAGWVGVPEHDGPEQGGGATGSGWKRSGGRLSASSVMMLGSRAVACRGSEAHVT